MYSEQELFLQETNENMIIRNIQVFLPDKSFHKGCIVTKDDKIERIYTQKEEEGSGEMDDPNLIEDAFSIWRGKPGFREKQDILDGRGAYAIPGLIDLHFHGCRGDDFCDGSMEAIKRIAEYEASVGVTAIAPATMTLPVSKLVSILRTSAEYRREVCDEGIARLVGINMEGPFISSAKRGAQDAKYIIPCDASVCDRFLEASGGLVKFIGIAPEASEDSISFIRRVKDRVHVALAHTDADYETALAAFRAGADHLVHMYNAMPRFGHRAPGVIGAALDSPKVMCEIICDGIHVHPSAIRAAFRMMGEERMILISDSMRGTGMPDGRYTLGGQEVDVRGRRATLVRDGSLAGSVTNLMDCLRTAVREAGIPLETAVACATRNPAEALGILDHYGTLEEGKMADVVLLDRNLGLQGVIVRGRMRVGEK